MGAGIDPEHIHERQIWRKPHVHGHTDMVRIMIFVKPAEGVLTAVRSHVWVLIVPGCGCCEWATSEHGGWFRFAGAGQSEERRRWNAAS